MSNPYIGEIRMFAGNFAPVGWEFCNGQLVPISENEALFQLIGTTYGGDGEATFALPDLRSRVPVHEGPTFLQGETGGVESVTLTVNQIPVHTHALTASQTLGNQNAPGGNLLAETPGGLRPYIEDSPSVNKSAQAVGPLGGSQPHPNMQPFLCISFIISMFGVFPQPT